MMPGELVDSADNKPLSRFVMFKKFGSLLCFYDSDQDDLAKLTHFLVVSKIKEFNGDVEGDSNKFQLVFDDNTEVLLRTDSSEMKELWIETLIYFEDLFKEDINEYKYSLTSLVEPIDRASIEGSDELSRWQEMKDEFDYSSFIKDKKLIRLFELNLQQTIKNRFALSSTYLNIVYKKSNEIDDSRKPEKDDNYDSSALEDGAYHIVVLNARPAFVLDRDFSLTDNYIMTKETIPNWMAFNHLYFFQYTSMGDITPFKMYKSAK